MTNMPKTFAAPESKYDSWSGLVLRSDGQRLSHRINGHEIADLSGVPGVTVPRAPGGPG